MNNTIRLGSKVVVTKPSLKSYGKKGTVEDLDLFHEQAQVKFDDGKTIIANWNSLNLTSASHEFKVGDWAMAKTGREDLIMVCGQITEIEGIVAILMLDSVGDAYFSRGREYKFLTSQLTPCDKPTPKEEGKFIIWNPTSPKPPVAMITGYDLAQKTAISMSNRFNEQFYVCELKGSATSVSNVKYSELA